MSLKESQQFEKGRIKALQDERVYIQKKTFTKWANAFLEKVRKSCLSSCQNTGNFLIRCERLLELQFEHNKTMQVWGKWQIRPHRKYSTCNHKCAENAQFAENSCNYNHSM